MTIYSCRQCVRGVTCWHNYDTPCLHEWGQINTVPYCKCTWNYTYLCRIYKRRNPLPLYITHPHAHAHARAHTCTTKQDAHMYWTDIFLNRNVPVAKWHKLFYKDLIKDTIVVLDTPALSSCKSNSASYSLRTLYTSSIEPP